MNRALFPTSFLPLCSASLLAFASVVSTHAASISYTNDFSGTGSNTALPHENSDAQWTVSGGANVNAVTPAGAATVSSTSIPIDNAASVSVLTLSTQFTFTAAGPASAPSAASTIGFGLFGSASNFSGTAPESYYLADFAFANGSTDPNEGRLRILSLGAANADFSAVASFANDANPGTPNLAVTLNTTYTLLLTATRTGTALSFNLGLYDAAGTTQIGTSAVATDPTALTGTFFGYRNRYEVQTGGAGYSASLDNLNMVPEPSTSLLGLLGLATMVRRRR